jgi:biopolymer transport protein ExbB
MESSFYEFVSIWSDGGPIMIPICLLALFLYGLAMNLFFRLRVIHSEIPHQDEWGHWVDKPSDAEGLVKDIILHTQSDVGSIDEMRRRFEEVRIAELPPLESRLLMLKNMVIAAPLLGLLGTVFGMISTFKALSVGSGKIIDMVAGGISEALITTEMGLLVAIPGYFLLSSLDRKRMLFISFLAQIESISLEKFRRKTILL